MTRVVLISPPLAPVRQAGVFKNFANVMPPLGIAYIAAATEAAGFEVRIIDCVQAQLTNQEAVEQCSSFSPQIIGITATVLTIQTARELSILIKKMIPEVRIVLGGPMISSMPELSLKEGAFDCGVLGEGELVFPKLCQQLKSGSWDPLVLPGIIALNDNGWEKTKRPPLINNIDVLPIPAWHLLPSPDSYRPMPAGYRRLPMAHMVTSRGCPYKCVYCDRSVFGNRFRTRSPTFIVNEMELLHREYGVKEIKFYDDLFNFSEKRVLAICDEIENRQLDISWSCMCRVDKVTDLMARAMKSAGCWQVDFGLESGNQRILDRMKKGLNIEDSIRGVKIARKAGLKIRAYFIVGMPGETKQSMDDSLNFALKLDIDIINLFALTLYPGNELFRELDVDGKVRHHDFAHYTTMINLDTHRFHYLPNGLTEDDIKYFIRYANRKFYLRYKYILGRLLSIRSLDDIIFYMKSGLLMLRM